MPFKSKKQERYLWANEPEVARKFSKYNEGGSVMRGLLDNMNEETTVTRKMADGSTVTVKSPKGAQMDMMGILGGQVSGPDMGPTADNVTAALTPGEYVVNRPAAQKYKPLLEEINNEGKMMLAQGGHIPGYAFGGQAEGYDNQRRIRKWLETVKPGSRDEEILLDRLGITNPKAFFTEENPDMGYGYATDDDPIISQGTPGPWAAEWAEQNGVDHTDYNLEKLEMLCKEAIADFGNLPQHEKDEWESERELAWYYMDEFAIEEGVTRGYWTGGEVGKGDPEEGDTADHIAGAGGIVFRDGNWVYKRSGKPVPNHILKKINDYAQTVAGDDVEEALPDDEDGSNVEIEKESHAKNYAWGKRAIEAEKVIRELIAGGFNPGSWEYAKGETLAKYLGDLARSAEGQRYKKAVESLVAAVLRKDTGAAIAADEFERTYRQLFGSLGTGEGAQQDAANQRARNIEGFIAASGPGSEELQKAWDAAQEIGAGAPEDPSTLSGEDVGGIAGGILGGVLGLFFGPAGAAALAAGGTYLGRALGQYLTDDDPSIIEALTPEMSDLIDTAIAPIGSGLGRAALAGFKAQVAKKALKDGVTDAGGVRNIARNIAEGGLVKGVAKSVAGDTVAEISEKYLSAGFKEVATESGKYFGKFLPNGLFKAVNAQTGRAIAQNTTEHKAVKAAFQAAKGSADDAAGASTATFATGGLVAGKPKKMMKIGKGLLG